MCTLLITVRVNNAIVLTQPQALLRPAKVSNQQAAENLLSGKRDDANSIFAPSLFLKLVQPSMKSSFLI